MTDLKFNITANLSAAQLEALVRRAVETEHPTYEVTAVNMKVSALSFGYGAGESTIHQCTGATVHMKPRPTREQVEEKIISTLRPRIVGGNPRLSEHG